MSIDGSENSNKGDANALGYKLFRTGLIKRFNPCLFAVKREDNQGWFLVELKDGKWKCDCNTYDEHEHTCPHIYAALLSSATSSVDVEEPPETAEEKLLRCRYCGSPDIRKVGFRYNAHGIARRYMCNECYRKFSVAYVEATSFGAPSGVLWLLTQIGMLTSKLNDLLVDLSNKIAEACSANSIGDKQECKESGAKRACID
jgi:DNA-directed RNA polymerase subunit RPC12/RpoP